jgi:hypothetical protein
LREYSNRDHDPAAFLGDVQSEPVMLDVITIARLAKALRNRDRRGSAGAAPATEASA